MSIRQLTIGVLILLAIDLGVDAYLDGELKGLETRVHQIEQLFEGSVMSFDDWLRERADNLKDEEKYK